MTTRWYLVLRFILFTFWAIAAHGDHTSSSRKSRKSSGKSAHAAARAAAAHVQPSCDSCRTLVEMFRIMWTTTTRKKIHSGDVTQTKNGHITYDGELETAVMSICDGEFFAKATTAVKDGCRTILWSKDQKRRLVAEFLSVEIVNMPALLRQFCIKDLGICTVDQVGAGGLGGAEDIRPLPTSLGGECNACRDMVLDTVYRLRQIPVDPTRRLRRERLHAILETTCETVRWWRTLPDAAAETDNAQIDGALDALKRAQAALEVCEEVRDSLTDDYETILFRWLTDPLPPRNLHASSAHYANILDVVRGVCAWDGMGVCPDRPGSKGGEL